MTRFILLGGFLGSGKTTALLRLARHYAALGKRVGVIANDQASGLVDTLLFRAAGFATDEVTDGCFCCRFDELLAAADRLRAPDVLLAEPTGSCTDLVATVIRPLEELYGDRFEVAPYVTLLDPERAYDALSGRSGFSGKVTYVFKMQQHEAAAVVINKSDMLEGGRGAALRELVARNFPRAEIVSASARTGAGFDRIVAILDAEAAPRATPDVDYVAYAEGEERLGWFNGVASVDAPDAEGFVLAVAGAIGDDLARVGAEVAHVKVLLGEVAASLSGSARDPELVSRGRGSGNLVVNARVECAAEVLRDAVIAAVERVAGSVEWIERREFAPGPPVPTHRYRG